MSWQQNLMQSMAGPIQVTEMIARQPGEIMPMQQRGSGVGMSLGGGLAQALMQTNNPQMPTNNLGAARDRMMDAAQTYSNTKSQRFRGGLLGFGESIYDIVKSKGAREEFMDASQAYSNEEAAEQERLMKEAEAKEMQERAAYVQAVMPLLQQRFPNQDPQALQQMAVQMAAQKMPIDKVFPKERDEATAPQQKTEKDANGFLRYFGGDKHGQRVYPDVATPEEEEERGKVYNTLPGTDKQRIALVSEAAHNLKNATDYLVDDQGNVKNWGPHFDIRGQGKVTLKDLEASVFSMLRNDSGANISDQEIYRDVALYVPQLGDSETVTKGKLARLSNRVNTYHSALTSGIEDMPDTVQIPDLGFAGMKQRGVKEEQPAADDLDARFEAAMKKRQAG